VTTAQCVQCGASLPRGTARLVLEKNWWCPDCVYEREYGPAARANARNGAALQAETLFPLPAPVRRSRRS